MYEKKIGLFKTIKNVIIQWVPAISAGYVAFLAKLPPEHQGIVAVVAASVAYYAKNWLNNKD